MKTNKLTYITLVFTGLFIFASCKVNQTYQRPNLKAAQLYRDSLNTDTTSIAGLHWRSLFSDTTLQNLIQEGINNNLDLKTAILKIAESQATLIASKAAYFPSLDAGVQATKAKSSQAALNFPAGTGIDLNTTTYQASLTASWEVNIWGQLSSLKSQAVANFFAKRCQQTCGANAIDSKYR